MSILASQRSHSTQVGKPDLVVRPDDLTITAHELATIIARSGDVFDRAGPVQVFPQTDGSAPR